MSKDEIPDTATESDDDEWPVSWIVKRLEAEIHDLFTRLNLLETRLAGVLEVSETRRRDLDNEQRTYRLARLL